MNFRHQVNISTTNHLVVGRHIFARVFPAISFKGFEICNANRVFILKEAEITA